MPESEREAEVAPNPIADYAESAGATSQNDNEVTPLTADEEPNWDGDGTHEMAADDSEWGGDAKARSNNLAGEDEPDATELARNQESLQSHLHRQALSLLSTADLPTGKGTRRGRVRRPGPGPGTIERP